MRSPDVYFSDPKEKELALLVWEKGREQVDKWEVRSGSTVTKVFLANATLPNERIMLLASDWITYTRGDGEAGSTDAVCGALGLPKGYFTGDQVANVEHAYRAAFLSITLSPAASFGGAAIWELVVDPLMKEPLIRAYNAGGNLQGTAKYKAIARAFASSYGWEKLKNSYGRNGSQFTGADMTGWMMGADMWDEFASTFGEGEGELTADKRRLAELRLRNGANAFTDLTEPKASPVPAYGPPWHVTTRGTSLSEIAKKRYGDHMLWPLIWDVNLAAVGPNPNRLPLGVTLKMRNKDSLTPEEIASARRRSPSWASYPH